MWDNLLSFFQGIYTLFHSEPLLAWTRLGLIGLGALLIYLGKKGTLEPLLMIPMGLGMLAVNAGVLTLANHTQGTLFLDPLVTEPNDLIEILQINCFQPIYTYTFSNGLIACFVFMGIGALLDVGYIMARPFESMFLALAAELGTIAVFPIAIAFGLSPQDAASIAMVGGADGPMVLYTSLSLSKDIFVPITVVAYLYLGLTYGGYPYLIKLMVPKRLRGLPTRKVAIRQFSSESKLAFAVIGCAVLCLLFPVAAPLFISLFLGVSVKEAGLTHYTEFMTGPLLYGSTLVMGLLLGVLCEARVMLDPKILTLLALGVLALLISGIGGILGGYVLYFVTKGRFNPVIGIAGVSCVPTTAKVAQKAVSEANPKEFILPIALGANISGVITTALLCGIYVTLLQPQKAPPTPAPAPAAVTAPAVSPAP